MVANPVGVLALTLDSRLGGTEKSILSLCSRMDKVSFRPSIATLIGDGSMVCRAREQGIDAHHLGMRGAWDISVVPRLWEIIRSRDISILHTFIYHTCILGRILGWAAMVPVVICSQRSTDNWRRPFHVLLDRFTQGLVSCYLANCEAVARRLREVEKIRPARIRVVRTGVESLRAPKAEDVRALRAHWNIPDGAKVIGTVANLRPAKGHSILIEAAVKIVREFPQTVFVWAGEGTLRQELEAKISREGLQKHFRLVGFTNSPEICYGAFDIFMLPSLWEGLPLALLEAMSLGSPLVATSVGGVPEILENGRDGLLVKPGDAGALAQATLALLRSESLRNSLGQNAKARFMRENSIERCVEGTQELYRSLLGFLPLVKGDN